jgi:3-methyl-2-oxobutanoate hydroxymethyltransferase
MPFLSYGASLETSVENAGRFLKEAGADAVKLETAPRGETTIDIVSRLTELGVPVVGHIGLTPQRMRQLGGGYVQGRGDGSSATVEALVDTATRLADAGAFAIVLEAVTEATGKEVTEAVDVPTIGIGAGRYVDGQVLVVTDLLGLSEESYGFSKAYADLGSVVEEAVTAYVDDVRDGAFPASEHVFDPVDEAE